MVTLQNQEIIFSLCNQDRKKSFRTHCLGVVNLTTSEIKWLRSGSGKRDLGVMGFAIDYPWLYVVVQSGPATARVNAIDVKTWRILHSYPLRKTLDPHSLHLHGGELYIASSGTNSVVLLRRAGKKIVSEEKFWTYPGVNSDHDTIHVNSIYSLGDDLIVSCFGPKTDDGKFGFDGEIYNIMQEREIIGKLARPHSPYVFENTMFVADSDKGLLIYGKVDAEQKLTDVQTIKLAGFTRGVVPLDAHTLIVGVSAHRKKSRSKGTVVAHRPDHYDRCELILVDTKTKSQRQVADLTQYGREIYELRRATELGEYDVKSPLSRPWLETIRAPFAPTLPHGNK